MKRIVNQHINLIPAKDARVENGIIVMNEDEKLYGYVVLVPNADCLAVVAISGLMSAGFDSLEELVQAFPYLNFYEL